jgi:hypothetical protein
MIGQLHQAEPQAWGMTTVILRAASTCQFHDHTQASMGFVVMVMSAPT